MDITTGRRLKSIALTLAVTAIGFGQNAATSRTANLTPASLPYIDAHTHIYQLDPEGAVTLILSAMERLNGAKAFIQTEPYGPDNPARWDAEMILPAERQHPDKLAVWGGGGMLNPMIREAYRTGNAGPEARKQFRQRAEALLDQGVVGCGELSIEHLSLPQSPVKDYEYAPADSPMMLLLADIAAEHNVPIDLHMEALPETIPTPKEYGPPNPPELHRNIAAFERLLAHNRRAQQNALLLNQLPPDVRKKIAMENALRIYGR